MLTILLDTAEFKSIFESTCSILISGPHQRGKYTPCPIDSISDHSLCFVEKADEQNHLLWKNFKAIIFCKYLEVDDHNSGNVTYIASQYHKYLFALLLSKMTLPPNQESIIDPSANIATNVILGKGVVIGPQVTIGPRSIINNYVVINGNTTIGNDCFLKSHAVIGEPGFGIVKDTTGNNFRMPQIGGVIIGDHVEVGSHTTICSGTLSPTKLGNFVKLDDHVHIAHNCHIGDNTIITACAELSGSVKIGKNVWIGPNSTLLNKISVGDDAVVAIGAVVTKNVGNSVLAGGNPARIIKKLET